MSAGEFTDAERQVIWVATRGYCAGIGMEPGSFNEALIQACFKADPENLSRLAMVFPELALTVKGWKTDGTDAGLGKRYERARAEYLKTRPTIGGGRHG